MRLKSLDDTILERLKDPEFAAAYLEEAYEDSLEEFFIAVGKFVRANDGMSRCAEKTQLSRESMYRSLSETGNPGFRSVDAILKSHGLKLGVQVQGHAALPG